MIRFSGSREKRSHIRSTLQDIWRKGDPSNDQKAQASPFHRKHDTRTESVPARHPIWRTVAHSLTGYGEFHRSRRGDRHRHAGGTRRFDGWCPPLRSSRAAFERANRLDLAIGRLHRRLFRLAGLRRSRARRQLGASLLVLLRGREFRRPAAFRFEDAAE